MSEFDRRCRAVATLIADYRQGEIVAPDDAHVARWVRQFPAAVHESLLAEMEHVLRKTYYSKAKVSKFLAGLVTHGTLGGDDPKGFWKTTEFLHLQRAGNSQREFLAIFEQALRTKTGLSLADCGSGQPQRFFYLDDALFSGGRIKSDLTRWIEEEAPQEAEVIVAVIGIHEQGHYFAKKDLAAAIKEAGKKIKIRWGKAIDIEDRIFNVDTSDVLRPTGPGGDEAVAAYVANLGKAQTWRSPGRQGSRKLFSGERGRELLEQEFLKAGVRIRACSPYLNDYQRPLGNTVMRTTGFGTMLVTWRNCPNNAPLVLWAGNPWYPLFPRKTN